MIAFIYLIYIVLSLIVFFSFYNLKIALSLYLSYLILIPYLIIPFGALNFSYNFIQLILTINLIFQFKNNKWGRINFILIKPFVLLYFSLFIISFFTFDTPIQYQLKNLISQFIKVTSISFVIWNLCLYDFKSLKIIKYCLSISFLLASFYGITLINLNGFNPYLMFLSNFFNVESASEIFSNIDSRLDFSNAGKIQSTMVHPMTWSLLLCFYSIIIFTYFLKSLNKFYLLFISILLINVLISGVRTGLITIVIGSLYLLFKNFNIKIASIALVFVLLLSFFILSNNSLSNLFNSFYELSETKNKVSGSSISLRLQQFDGALKIITSNPFFGKGYNWNVYYREIHGDHPVLLAFESLIFIVLCNNGVFGIIIWFSFMISLIRLNSKFKIDRIDKSILNSIVLMYFTFIIVTGEYGYIFYFSIIYTYLYSYFLNSYFKSSKFYFK